MFKSTSNSNNLSANGFPTEILKSLLENSELLEILLKPISSENDDLDELANKRDDCSIVEAFNERSEKLCSKNDQSDNLNCETASVSLAHNLWNKNDLLQGERYGLKLECLDFNQFLNENGLNTNEIEIINEIHSTSKQENEPNFRSAQSISSLLDDHGTLIDSTTTRGLNEKELDSLVSVKKARKQFVPNELKDDRYWSRRCKNNVAAKRSRDARRIKENQVARRALYLELENEMLHKELDECKRKLAKYEKI